MLQRTSKLYRMFEVLLFWKTTNGNHGNLKMMSGNGFTMSRMQQKKGPIHQCWRDWRRIEDFSMTPIDLTHDSERVNGRRTWPRHPSRPYRLYRLYIILHIYTNPSPGATHWQNRWLTSATRTRTEVFHYTSLYTKEQINIFEFVEIMARMLKEA